MGIYVTKDKSITISRVIEKRGDVEFVGRAVNGRAGRLRGDIDIINLSKGAVDKNFDGLEFSIGVVVSKKVAIEEVETDGILDKKGEPTPTSVAGAIAADDGVIRDLRVGIQRGEFSFLETNHLSPISPDKTG